LETEFWRDQLFEDFERLIEINVKGRRLDVPDKNKILRCFQYLEIESISNGDYCWNGDCVNCQIHYLTEEGEIKGALACRMYAVPGLIITNLSEQLNLDLASYIDTDLGLNK
jgi:hypothetical protein